MPRRTTQKPQGLGKAIEKSRLQRIEPRCDARNTGVAERLAGRSVLDQNSLDDYLATAELTRKDFTSTRNTPFQMVEAPRLVCTQEENRDQTAFHRARVPIPRRPAWSPDMDAEELAALEGEAFVNWRRSLAKMEEVEGLTMTPYEKNLDFWRQLWRCVERSDLLVQILDARDPDFYRSQDLERYVTEVGTGTKRHLLLLNKSDFLTPELRRQWAEHFAALGVDFLFFSALTELRKQNRFVPAPRTPSSWSGADARAGADSVQETLGHEDANEQPELPPHGQLTADCLDVMDCARLLEELRSRLPKKEQGEACVVGFVGYPNVGKSSAINALLGKTKVSMSRTPGKTKHIQTLDLPGQGITLCDCPGLVFPSVVATKAHLSINGVVPIDELRDVGLDPSVRLIIKKVGLEKIHHTYGLTAEVLREAVLRRGGDDPSAARVGMAEAESAKTLVDQAGAVVAGIALLKRRFLRFGLPDETWGSRTLIRDYCTGAVLHCESPLTTRVATPLDAREVAVDTALAPVAASVVVASDGAEKRMEQDEEGAHDFDDIGAFLGEEATSQSRRKPKPKKASRGG